MDTTTARHEPNFLTTTKITFVIQQRWADGQDWSDAHYVSASHTVERAMEKAAKYRAGIAKGHYYDGKEDNTIQPQLRIQQRVSEWTPLHFEV
jgi:hypothetical protein